MMLTLSEEEMLERWRLLTMLEPMAPSGVIASREDYTPLSELSRLRMRAWYARLLDDADPALVPVSNIRRLCSLRATDGLWELSLPEGTRRVLSVRFPGWSRPVSPLPPEAARCSNPFLSGASGEPAVVQLSPLKLLIDAPMDAPVSINDPAGEVMATMMPADGSFILDDKAFGLISEHDMP